MTDIDTDVIRQREQAATEGPWTLRDGWGPARDGLARCSRVANKQHDNVLHSEGRDIAGGGADLEFIAAARTAVPALLAKVDELTAELERMREGRRGLVGKIRELTAALAERDATITVANRRADGLANDLRSAVKGNDAYANENARLRSQLAEQGPTVLGTVAAAIRSTDSGIDRGTRPIASAVSAALDGIGVQWHPATVNEVISQVDGWDEIGAAELAHHIVVGLDERAKGEKAEATR